MQARLILWFFLLALFLPVAAVAQEVRPNDLPASVTVPPAIRKKIRDGGATVSLELQGVTSEAALSQLLAATKYNYVFDSAFYEHPSVSYDGPVGNVQRLNLNLPPRVITLRMANVPLDRALDTVTQAIGVGWTVEGDTAPPTLRIVKLRGTMTASDMVGARGGIGGGGGGFPGGGISGGGKNEYLLPDARVKLDSRQISLRDALSDVLKQAKIDFALDEDVSASEKRAFTFENIGIATALDVLTESAGLGWRVEFLEGKGNLVRVGKRYAPSSIGR